MTLPSNSYAPPEPPLLMPQNPRKPSYAPLEVPPEVPASSLPELPSPPRAKSSLPPALARDYKLTTHIVTAAWPRLPSQLYDPAAYEVPQNEGKAERRARVDQIYAKLDGSRILADRGEGPARKEVLYNVLNRYRRKDRWIREGGERGITLFVTHGVGFPKEASVVLRAAFRFAWMGDWNVPFLDALLTSPIIFAVQIWEYTLAKLVDQTEHSPHGPKINEIWAFEAYNHGESALINEGNMGTMNCFEDTTRDIINFMLNYLPHNAGADYRNLPVHLKRLPREIAEGRRTLGYAGDRTVVGLGHSAGAAVMEEALSLYRISPSFSYWDSDVLKAFVDHGIIEDLKGGVRLKTPTIQEAMWFMEADALTKAYETLARLPPSVELLLLYSSRSSAGTGGEISTRHVAYRRPKNTRNLKLDSSHLMVQESPQLVADTVFDFLDKRYSRAAKDASISVGARL
ncbi:hypothetical protein DL93DRAFT_2233650 [Clavulina sp. PMI_390]|nr:hypothetical protein DL93DRAFT_2233650 [Clavulina sp. PMI_390]